MLDTAYQSSLAEVQDSHVAEQCWSLYTTSVPSLTHKTHNRWCGLIYNDSSRVCQETDRLLAIQSMSDTTGTNEPIFFVAIIYT